MGKELSINHVCICAATYLRPKGLSRLLDSLNNLNVSDLPSNILVSVVIVDNDPNQSSATIINEYKTKGFRFSLDYFVESARGIPQARNRLLLAAKDLKADVIAMIDDDETVDENWLSTGLKAMDQWDADVIFGHLEPVFETAPPKWIKDEGYFEYPLYKDETALCVAYTYNVFFKTKILETVPGFDNYLNLKGGEDTIFFSEVYRAGFSIKFCSLCIVYDHIPKQRMNLKWFLIRNFRAAGTFYLVDLNKNKYPTLISKISPFIKSIQILISDFLLSTLTCYLIQYYTFNPFKKPYKLYREKISFQHYARRKGFRGFLCRSMYNIGTIAALFGYMHQEYSKPTTNI